MKHNANINNKVVLDIPLPSDSSSSEEDVSTTASEEEDVSTTASEEASIAVSLFAISFCALASAVS